MILCDKAKLPTQITEIIRQEKGKEEKGLLPNQWPLMAAEVHNSEYLESWCSLIIKILVAKYSAMNQRYVISPNIPRRE